MNRVFPTQDQSQQNDQHQKIDYQQVIQQGNLQSYPQQNDNVQNEDKKLPQIQDSSEQPFNPFSPTFIVSHENMIKANKNKTTPQYQQQNSVQQSINVISCKICLLSSQDEESAQLGQLINICDCKGSIQYVHFYCQKDILEKQHGKTKEQLINESTSQPFQKQKKRKRRYEGIRKHKCELCSKDYQVEWTSSLIKRPYQNLKSKKSCLFFTFILTLITFILLLFTVLYLSLQDFNQYYFFDLMNWLYLFQKSINVSQGLLDIQPFIYTDCMRQNIEIR